MKTSEANIEDLRNQTVSWGTHRPDDLIPKFMAVLKEYGKEAYDKYVSENPEVEDWKKLDDETKGWVVDELFDLLDGIAPEDCYFGAHPGDGADFGFWQVDESKKNEAAEGSDYFVIVFTSNEDAVKGAEYARNLGEDPLLPPGGKAVYVYGNDRDALKAFGKKWFDLCVDDDLGTTSTFGLNAKDESKKSEADGNKDIFTLDLTRIYADGDEEGLDDMQAAQNFYDEDEAIQAAKDLADSYKDDDDVVQVTVMAGEQEKPNGDIVGDSFDIFTASSSDSATTAKYREKAGYTTTDGLDYYAKGGKSEAKKSEARPTKQDAQIKELCKLCRNDKNVADSVFKALTKDYNTSLDPVLAGQYLMATWKSKLEELGGCNGWYDGFKKLYAAMGSDFVCSVLQDLKLGSSEIGCGACITIVDAIYDKVVKRNEAKKSEDFDMNKAFFQAKKAITDWTKRQGHKTLEWLYTDGRKSPTSYPSGIWDFEWDTGNGMATAELKVSPYETRTNSWNDSMDFSLRVGTEDKPTFYTSVEDVLSALDTLISETEESKKSESLNPVSVDAITKDDFDAYVAVQRSGKYNMIMDADAAADDADLDIDTYYGIIKNYGALVSKYGRKGKSLSESLTLKQKELKNMARYGEATDITTISDAEAKELKKKGIETVGISRGAYGMNGALLRDNEGNKYVITARSSNLFYFV